MSLDDVDLHNLFLDSVARARRDSKKGPSEVVDLPDFAGDEEL